MAMLFDLSDELHLVDRAPDEWNTDPEQLFYALRACGMLAVIIPVFEGEKTEKGVVITAYGKFGIHEFMISDGQVLIGSQSLDSKIDAPIDHFLVGSEEAFGLGRRPFAMSSKPSGPASR